jgi:hypothetical protein
MCDVMQATAQSGSYPQTSAQPNPPPTVSRVKEPVAAEGGAARREGRERSANPCCTDSVYASSWVEGWDTN